MKPPLHSATITLWTLQHRSVWERLKAGQTVQAPEELCWPEFDGASFRDVWEPAYAWMARQLAHRDPPPEGVRWPVWAHWCAGDEGPIRPDLRRYRAYEPGVMLELTVDANRVLLSDFGGWHDVLNDGFNGRGWTWFQDAWDNSLGDAVERERLTRIKRRSWRRCLAVNPSRSMQAVLWQIRPDDVVRHWFYNGYPHPRH